MDKNDIEAAILDAMIESRDLPREFDRMLELIADAWRGFTPVGTGEYRSHIQTERYRAPLTRSGLRRGEPVGRVWNDDEDEKVLAIEYGSADTPEFAPMRKTYARFMN
ncbi:hypothetical protein [Mycobacterium antarcticum]|uniref:hypothetical protein n=1 Tax=Mycolicibacterium sp. TUM20984 TaxID=3023368 RepID=UPI00239C79D8|nr:hypothetical protein [Mycolicibacterium sp. TUM20984]GLP83597.1 hypothetical protein TUM20984_50170 [Mycolicibacterium sp. TUM20984]